MTDDIFMTVRDIVKEIREDVKKLQNAHSEIEKNMVTKTEFEAFKKAAVLSAQWKVGTTLTLVALVTTVIALIVSL